MATETYVGWLKTREAAVSLQVHVETVRRWARTGEIHAAKLGNRGGFRFRRDDLERFMDDHRPK
jgi:excisionase family DNA binding protein